jgi:eukaryotic-like serine/threonine-protein kinase
MCACASREQLTRYMRNQLDRPAHDALSSHIEECDDCRRQLGEITTLSEGGGESRAVPADADQVALVLQHVKARGPRPASVGHQEQRAQGQNGSHSHVERSFDEPGSERPLPSTLSWRYPAIDGFRIIREIGRGGMGVVYEAEEEKLSRRVALKILPGTAPNDENQIRRFEREARAAARLHHTNIVPVFGVGQQDGHPYYVMQYIEGPGLDRVLAELRRLRQAGVRAYPHETSERPQDSPDSETIRGDADERPARIDAAAVARSLVSGTFAAGAGPPGQISATGTRSGDTVVFPPPIVREPHARPDPAFPLLPGSTELSVQSDLKRPYFEAVAKIGLKVAEAIDYANSQGVLRRDIKPSNLLLDTDGNVWVADFGLAKMTEADDMTGTGQLVGTIRYMAPERFRGQCDARSDVYSLGLTLYELVALRPAFEESDRFQLIERIRSGAPLRLKGLAPKVPRDLETIIHKASAHDAGQRYATSAALAEDLRRLIEGRTILARRAGAPERVVRWCRRNPGAAVSILILCLGTAVSTWQAFRATRAERTAKRAEAATGKQRDRAESEAEIAKAVNEFLNKDLLAQVAVHIQAGPSIKPDPNLKVRTAFDRAAGKVGERFASKPLVEASVRYTIGEAYLHLGLYAPALEHLERARDLRRRALGEEHPDTLETLMAIGLVYFADEKVSQAAPLLVAAMDGLRAAAGTEDPRALDAAHKVAHLYFAQGRHREAEELLVSLLDTYRRIRGPVAQETLDVVNSLGVVFEDQNKHKDAERLLEGAVRESEQQLGERHPNTLTTMSNLGQVYLALGRNDEGERLWKQVLDARRELLGPQHPGTLYSMAALGHFYVSTGKLQLGEPLLLEAREGCRASLDRDSETTELVLASLSAIYSQRKDLDKLASVLIEAARIARARSGADDPVAASATNSVAMLFFVTRKFDKAETHFREYLSYLLRREPDGANRFVTENRLGTCLLEQKKDLPEAERLFQECRTYHLQHNPNGEDRFVAEGQLGACLLEQKKQYAEAERLLLSAYRGIKAHRKAVRPSTAAMAPWVLQQLNKLYTTWPDPDRPRDWLIRLQDLAFPSEPLVD